MLRFRHIRVSQMVLFDAKFLFNAQEEQVGTLNLNTDRRLAIQLRLRIVGLLCMCPRKQILMWPVMRKPLTFTKLGTYKHASLPYLTKKRYFRGRGAVSRSLVSSPEHGLSTLQGLCDRQRTF